MEQYRKRFGSSVAEQQCKRKKKRNAQKELNRKAKKSKEQILVPTSSEKEPNKEEEERSEFSIRVYSVCRRYTLAANENHMVLIFESTGISVAVYVVDQLVLLTVKVLTLTTKYEFPFSFCYRIIIQGDKIHPLILLWAQIIL